MRLLCNDMNHYSNNILQIICLSEGQYPLENYDYYDNHAGFLHDLDESPPFYLPRMWALYGDAHKGACLVFDKSLLIHQTCNQLKKNYHCLIKKVAYTDFIKDQTLFNMVSSQDFEEEDVKKLKPHGLIQKYLFENAEYNYFNKDADWDDEHECRILIWNKKENTNFSNKLIDISGSIKAIVFGINFNDDIDLIKEVKNIGIDVYKLKIDEYIKIEEL